MEQPALAYRLSLGVAPLLQRVLLVLHLIFYLPGNLSMHAYSVFYRMLSIQKAVTPIYKYTTSITMLSCVPEFIPILSLISISH